VQQPSLAEAVGNTHDKLPNPDKAIVATGLDIGSPVTVRMALVCGALPYALKGGFSFSFIAGSRRSLRQ